jgi:hypothetical protein
MIIPINDSSAEVIIRNSISNINITVYTKLQTETINENKNFEVLGNIINGKPKRKVASTDNKFNSPRLGSSKGDEDSFILNQEEKLDGSKGVITRNSDSLLKQFSTEQDKKNNTNLSINHKVPLILI